MTPGRKLATGAVMKLELTLFKKGIFHVSLIKPWLLFYFEETYFEETNPEDHTNEERTDQ